MLSESIPGDVTSNSFFSLHVYWPQGQKRLHKTFKQGQRLIQLYEIQDLIFLLATKNITNNNIIGQVPVA